MGEEWESSYIGPGSRSRVRPREFEVTRPSARDVAILEELSFVRREAQVEPAGLR